MIFSLTNAGIASLNAAGTTPPVLGIARLGSASNYIPGLSDTAIHGSTVFETNVSSAQVFNSNTLIYTVYLDPTIGPFSFGEVGLLLPSGELFALGSSGSMVTKVPNSSTGNGNTVKIDCYVSTVFGQHNIYSSLANDEKANLNAVGSVDALPPAYNVEPNVFIAPHPAFPDQSLIATANNSTWTLSEYNQPAATGVITFVSPTLYSVTYTSLPFGDFPALAYPGYLVVQMLTGPAAGNIRIVSSTSGTSVGIVNPLFTPPNAGDSFSLLACTNLSADSINLLAGLDPAVTAEAINSLVLGGDSEYLRRDGSLAMQDNLNFGGHKAIGLGSPVNPNDAVTLQYMQQALANIGSQPQFELDYANLTSIVFTADATTNQVMDSFLVTDYRSVNYAIQISSEGLYQTTNITVVHDGLQAYSTEYGAVSTSVKLATFDADISSGSLRLLITPINLSSEVKAVRTCILP